MKHNSQARSSEPLRESASELFSDWREFLCRLADEGEKFTRDKPAVGLAAAFIAGAFLNSLFRRR